MQEILNFVNMSWDKSWLLIKSIMLIYGIGLAIEYLKPTQHNQPATDIGFNMIYTINFILINTFIMSLFSKVAPTVIELSGGPIFKLSFPATLLGELEYTTIFLFIYDFFYYWYHRLQHQSAILWQQHKLHHSEQTLNITTGNRHHWLENWFRIFLITIPMGWLIKLEAEFTGLIWSTLLLWGYFIHMNLRLNLGFLTPILAGPQYHRIHHSILKSHQDKNFAAFFPIYDIIFKTYYRPEKQEYPHTGLFSGEYMNNLFVANFSPFMCWWHMANSKMRGVK